MKAFKNSKSKDYISDSTVGHAEQNVKISKGFTSPNRITWERDVMTETSDEWVPINSWAVIVQQSNFRSACPKLPQNSCHTKDVTTLDHL